MDLALICLLKTVALTVIAAFPYNLSQFAKHKLIDLHITDGTAYLTYKVKGSSQKYHLEIYPTVDNEELCFYQPESDYLHIEPMPITAELGHETAYKYIKALSAHTTENSAKNNC
jgi:hypothetical protein